MIQSVRLKTVAWIVLVILLIVFIGDMGFVNISFPIWFAPLIAILCLLYIVFEDKF